MATSEVWSDDYRNVVCARVQVSLPLGGSSYLRDGETGEVLVLSITQSEMRRDEATAQAWVEEVDRATEVCSFIERDIFEVPGFGAQAVVDDERQRYDDEQLILRIDL